MTNFCVMLNQIASMFGRIALAPIAWLPGWLSAVLVSVATGIVMLAMFKLTSNQTAIKRVRNQIRANLLALSLFKDSVAVGLRAQCRILGYAARLMLLSFVPMLVMLVPVTLLLGQLALWYQRRPLQVDEPTVVTVQVHDAHSRRLADLQLQPSAAVIVLAGPVRVPQKQMVCWTIQAAQAGMQPLSFAWSGERYAKELAVGTGFMPTSIRRPPWSWTEVLMHPRERPFGSESAVQAIEIDYPQRSGWISGSQSWLMFWLVGSMIAAFALRSLFGVQL